MKNLIVNADDFGLSKSINRGIIESFKEGIVRSASLMVNMPGFEDALSLIKVNPGLGVGLHINLLRGQPLSSARGNDYFSCSIWAFLRKVHIEGIKKIEVECRAQIEKALKNKVTITHLDSEKNIHMVPKIFELFVKMAHDYRIGRVRNIHQSACGVFSKRYLITKYFDRVYQENRDFAQRYNVRIPDYYFRFFENGNITVEVLEKAFKSLREGTTEMVCHPGYIDDEWTKWPLNREPYYINNMREEELKVLISPHLKGLIHILGINLIS